MRTNYLKFSCLMDLFRNRKKRLPVYLIPPAPYHTLSINQVAGHTKTDIDDGLTVQEATQRLGLYGFNELSGQSGVSALAKEVSSLLLP
ncbi:hypothetical protein RclHR1_12320002 [Rhizophagus clarus]|uniref:Cation-transporting P-type ATPase N-terminal domain-containing protein n=1 Tax=Rhizophagus clarus TaxID=94130 RepID=A0A2Z6Q8K2_9GLOM|nr:hypothetical protein RclHR1_12320002 [Rhizophagus clarus]